MPVDALPIPHPPRLTGLVNLYRGYYDILSRPMSGVVTISGNGDEVKVALVEGVMDVNIPPGEYGLLAELYNVDGATSIRTEDVTLSRPV